MNNTLINMLLLNNKYIYTTWFIIEIIFVLRMRHLFLGLFHTFLFLTIHDKKTLIFKLFFRDYSVLFKANYSP